MRRTSVSDSIMLLDIESEEFKCSDLKEMKASYWCTVSCSFGFYVTVINAIVVASSMLQDRFGYTEDETGFYYTLPYLVTSVSSPFIGGFVDYTGIRMPTILTGASLLFTAHMTLLLVPDCVKCWYSKFPFIILGLAYCTYTVVLYPLVALQVTSKVMGTAFGTMSVLSNFGTFIAPPIVGYIKDNTTKLYGYFWVEMFFIFISFGVFTLLIFVTKFERQRQAKEKLRASEKQRLISESGGGYKEVPETSKDEMTDTFSEKN